eukprot:TRINITY_DN31262_c0_g1_i1.p1 TRINITY_DN31262_c0_g1~~TRINITY_DN31262_c0_g1_i1.p1  ORF type:complete len:226 (+),score=63.51 TRINITY_DN31262_c0_g1_i1:37-678(+)
MAGRDATVPRTRKRKPNKLGVEDAGSNDASVVYLHSDTMNELQLFRGDTVVIKSKRGKTTVCIVLQGETVDKVEPGNIKMHETARKNVGVRLGSMIFLHPCNEIEYGSRIRVLPIDNTEDLTEIDIFDRFLKPYFEEAYRPVRKNDSFVVKGATRAIEFKVVETHPGEYCIVAPDTVIDCKEQASSPVVWIPFVGSFFLFYILLALMSRHTFF